MKLTNDIIYRIAEKLSNFSTGDLYIPARINFFIQKNIKNIMEAAEDIEKQRMLILKHYGKLEEEKQAYKIPSDKIEEASKELKDLFSINQEIDIKKISLNDLEDLKFTSEQMLAIMFMIDEN